MTLCMSGTTEFFTMALFNESEALLGEMNFFTQRIQRIGLSSIELLLESQLIDVQKIKSVGIDTGPGAFTGLRIALAMAKTIAYSNDCPVFECSSLDLIRQNSANDNVIVAIDGKQKRVYTRIYENGKLSKIMDISPEHLKEITIKNRYENFEQLGTGFVNYVELRNRKFNEKSIFHYPFAKNMPLCFNGPYSFDEVSAKYYRKTQAEEKKDENSGN